MRLGVGISLPGAAHDYLHSQLVGPADTTSGRRYVRTDEYDGGPAEAWWDFLATVATIN